MTEKVEIKCNLEVTRNGRSECWALCNKYHNSFKCCLACDENNYCKKICGVLREERKRI